LVHFFLLELESLFEIANVLNKLLDGYELTFVYLFIAGRAAGGLIEIEMFFNGLTLESVTTRDRDRVDKHLLCKLAGISFLIPLHR
jgi:hypothetical protein